MSNSLLQCLICKRNQQIEQKENPYFVIELETGYVVLGDYQFYKGYTFFLHKKHVGELHELTPKDKLHFLEEMSLVGEAVYKGFKPNKLNYELLGNSEQHLHWHIIPRYQDDPSPREPVWKTPKEIRCAEKYKAENMNISELKKQLEMEIRNLIIKKTVVGA